MAAEWSAIDPEAVDEALDRLPRAWTVADYALRVLADVHLIDTAVHGCRETIWYGSREAWFLFPPTSGLLNALSCAALAHVARFEYRLDLGDLDEATFLAEQVLTLGREGGLETGSWVRASMANARADLWRYRVLGNPDLIDVAAPDWEGYYEFAADESLAAGRRVRLFAGTEAALTLPAQTSEVRRFQGFASTDPAARRLPAEGVDLRLVTPDGGTIHARRFAPDSSYVAVTSTCCGPRTALA